MRTRAASLAMEWILSELEGFSRGSLNSMEMQITTADGRKVRIVTLFFYVKPPRTDQTLFQDINTKYSTRNQQCVC